MDKHIKDICTRLDAEFKVVKLSGNTEHYVGLKLVSTPEATPTSAGGEQKNAGHGVVLPKRLAVAL
jgi:hypothetical protein